MFNKHGIMGFDPADIGTFEFNWLGAKVNFEVLGHIITGTVDTVDAIYHDITVDFNDGKKIVTVRGHFRNFKKLN